MRILQPAEWSKPRGFSHGVVVDGPGRWIVLAGQTGGDEKGEYQGDMAGQVGVALRRIIKLLAEAGAGPRTHRAPDLVFDQQKRIRSRRRRDRCGLARDAGAGISRHRRCSTSPAWSTRAKVEIEVTAFVPTA